MKQKDLVITPKSMMSDMEPYMTSDDYLNRLKTCESVSSMGRVGLLLYLLGGGRKYPWRATKHIQSATLATRVLDDMLDGDGVPMVKDRKRFLAKYLKSFSTGIMPEHDDVPEEKIAYQSAKSLHDFFVYYEDVHFRMEQTMEKMLAKVIEEDKTHLESYYSYIEAAGADGGEFYARSLQPLSDFSLEAIGVDAVRQAGRVGILLDHIVDRDVQLDDADVRDVYAYHLQKLRHQNRSAAIFSRLMLLDRPDIYRLVATLDRTINKTVFDV